MKTIPNVPLCHKCFHKKTKPGEGLKSNPSVRCTLLVGCDQMSDAKFQEMIKAPLDKQGQYCPILKDLRYGF